jgi:hypothetical protein
LLARCKNVRSCNAIEMVSSAESVRPAGPRTYKFASYTIFFFIQFTLLLL